MAGSPINWAMPAGARLATHPLYIKYSSTQFQLINAVTLKADLGLVMATADSSGIVAYLSWLLRVIELIQP